MFLLDSYKNSQQDFYSMVSLIVRDHQKISHAYLIDTADFADADGLVMSFAKFLLCSNHYTNYNQCKNCKICTLIDSQCDDHIQVISPDGMWIKKEQLLNLKNSLSKTSIDGLPQIYIIKEADRLNKSAANSLLKFIEEPEEGIIAILVSNNRYKILPTILSRCQIYSLKGQNTIENDIAYENMFDFIMNLERSGCQAICYIQDLWHSKYKTKEGFLLCFSNLEVIFMDLIRYKIKEETQFQEFLTDICYITKKNSEEELTRKLSKIIECHNQISCNVNLNLLMDKFIIEYVGGVIDG